jgi:hypothetical protein
MLKILLPFIASSVVLAATPTAARPANSYEQSSELQKANMPGAYNASARPKVRGSWDIYFTGSYLYWQPMEENLELGILGSADSGILSTGSVVQMDFKYKDGFKVGFGFFPSWDHWDAYAEYTWFKSTNLSHATASSGQALASFWGNPEEIADKRSGKSRWHLKLDIIDLNLGRSYYAGKELTFRPFFGARSAWIRQHYHSEFVPDTGPSLIENLDKSTSWSIGPEVGLLAHYLVGCGFRLIGSAELDVLYTNYDLTTQAFEDSVLVTSLQEHHLKYLRPHMDLELGLGWGSYFSNHNYHIDLLATYGFQVFWNQNMFRRTGLAQAYYRPVPNGDLFIQGLTAECRFDF